MHRVAPPVSTLLAVVALTLATAGAAQTTTASLRLVHAMPGAADATLHVAGSVVANARAGTAGDGYVAIEAGSPEVVVDVDGVRVAADPVELRAGFRYQAVLYRSDAGAPTLDVIAGPVGRVDGGALLRTVNLVPHLDRVRTYLHDACEGSWRNLAFSFGGVAPYDVWEYNHSGPMTVCAGTTALAPTRTRPDDPSAPWLLAGRSLSVFVVLGTDGPEVLFVDDTP